MNGGAILSNRMKLDCLQAGLLTLGSSWTVHLGSNSPNISGFSSIADFVECSYPGYAPIVWDPQPLAINGAQQGVALGLNFVAPPPLTGSATIQSCYVTYIAPDWSLQVLESFIMPNAPVILTGALPTLTINLSLLDFDANL